MSNKNLKISIVTISYNQGCYIEETIKSVIGQDYTNIEYIVIDGGSTDNTIDILKKYDGQISYWESKPDNGAAHALNKGFNLATGDFVYYINSDDYILPDIIGKVVKYIVNNPEYDIYYGHGIILDEINECKYYVYSDIWDTFKYGTGGLSILQQGTFIRKGIFIKTNGFNEENKSQWDGELLLDLALVKARFHRLPWRFKIGVFRIHGFSISGSQKDIDRYRNEKERLRKKINQLEVFSKFTYPKWLYDPFVIVLRGSQKFKLMIFNAIKRIK